MTIRRARDSDRAELFRLVNTFPTPTPATPEAHERTFAAALGDDAFCLLVAEDAGPLVGYLAGHRHHTFYASGPVAWVDELLVAETSRGHGIGQALMRAFERWARENGCVLVSLATRGAAGFYEKIGYVSKASYYKKYLLSQSNPVSRP